MIPRRTLLATVCLTLPLLASADGLVVDKIYHPYVEPLERELEWRLVWQDEQPGRADREQRQPDPFVRREAAPLGASGDGEEHQKYMMGEIAKLIGDGKLDEAAYNRTAKMVLDQKIITKEPTGAWTHDITDKAM